jgi:tRNA (guanine37-N1)-methyltransferase
MLQFDVVTLFPAMFDAVTEHGVTGRARSRGLFQVVAWNPRDFTSNAHRTVDDRPYGGGPGMVMLVEPLRRALQAARQRQRSAGVARPCLLCLSPQGRVLDHARVAELSRAQGLVLLAGRYEGIDERLFSCEEIEEVSIGDYVLSGGELAAMVLMDAVVRQLPGVLGDAGSASQDSFVRGLLDHPHFTRPEIHEGLAVPAELMSGNHAVIARWRLKQALGRTWQRRPDLLARLQLDHEQLQLLEEYRREQQAGG